MIAHSREPLGLARGTVRLVPSDPRWPQLFHTEAARVAAAVARAGLPALTLEHVGSTSVPGLCAKPILDLLAGRPPAAPAAAYVAALAADGYEPRGEQGVPDRELLVRGPEAKRTHYLHLVPRGGVDWEAMLTFRDCLRADPEAAAQYAAVKQALAERLAGDRPGYTAGKAAFVAAVLRRSSRGPKR